MDCSQFTRLLSNPDADALTEATDRHLQQGMSPSNAQRRAALELLMSVQAERQLISQAMGAHAPTLQRPPIQHTPDPELNQAITHYIRSTPDPEAAPRPDRRARGESARRSAAHTLSTLAAPLAITPTRSAHAAQILRSFARRQHLNLVGAHAPDALSIATLAQIYRHPTFETARLFFLDPAGHIVAQIGVTSRLPSASHTIIGPDLDTYLNTLAAEALAAGATQAWMLHNHPSGDSRPSAQDIAYTRNISSQFAQRGIQILGHVVIDTNEFSHISPQGDTTRTKVDFGAAPLMLDWGTDTLTSPGDTMRVAKALYADRNTITLIALDNQSRVRGVTDIPAAEVMRRDADGTLRRYMQRQLLATLGSRLVAVGQNPGVLYALDGMIFDAVHIEHGRPRSWAEAGYLSHNTLMPDPLERAPRVSPDTTEHFDHLKSYASALRIRTMRRVLKGLSPHPNGPNSNPGATLAEPAPQTHYTLRPFTLPDQVVAVLQDRRNRWRQTIEDIQAQGGTVDDSSDFYKIEETSYGVAVRELSDFQDQFDQWLADVRADDLHPSDVVTWAYAQYAPIRNTHIASINPAMPDGGSGWDNQGAADHIADQTAAGLAPVLQRHADTLRGFIQDTRNLLWANNLLSDQDHADWSAEPLYVPLKGLSDAAKAASGAKAKQERRRHKKSLDVRGKESEHAMGRRSRATQILEHIITDRVTAIERASHNDILRAFGRFVLDNPAPHLWEFQPSDTKRFMGRDDEGNFEVQARTRPVKDETTITFKDGGRELRVRIKDPELLSQFKGLDEEKVGAAMAAMLAANRAVTKLLTQLNPEFAWYTNPVRDIQEAAINMTGHKGYKAAGQFLGAYPSALAQSLAAEFGRKSPAYDQFERAGGKVGFMGFQAVEDVAKEIAAQVKRLDQHPMDPRRMARLALKYFEAVGTGFENAPRLAAYSLAISRGNSPLQAASLAKNISPNFNRRGKWRLASAWFWFFNAAMQGTANAIRALRSPKVQALIGTMGASIAATVPLMVAIGGEDDDGVAFWDKVPDHEKARNWIFMLPPGSTSGEPIPGTKRGRYFKIPMSLSYAPFFAASYGMADAARHAADPATGKPWTHALGMTLQAMAGIFVPVTDANSWIAPTVAAKLSGAPVPDSATSRLPMMAVPDIAKPVANVLANSNNFGRPLRSEFNPHLPASSRGPAYLHGTIWDQAAKGLNRATGGNDLQAGLVSLSSGDVRELVAGYAGALTAIPEALANSLYVNMSVQREDIRAEKAPFVRRLYGEINEWGADPDAWGTAKSAMSAKALMRDAAKSGATDAQMLEIEQSLGPLLDLAGHAQQRSKRLSELRKREIEVLDDSTLSEAKKMEHLQMLAVEKRLIDQAFNRATAAAVREDRANKAKAAPP